VNEKHPSSDHIADNVTIGMMTKYWIAGRVKTRLAKAMGAEIAARLHREFTMQLCKNLAECGDRRILCLDPLSKKNEVKRELNRRGVSQKWEVEGQSNGDLGSRIDDWFNSQARKNPSGNGASILIGSDTPSVNKTHVQDATKCLRESEVVIGPARDGGYYLIGIRDSLGEPVRKKLFTEIPWSTHSVLQETRQRLIQTKTSWKELGVEEDVDTVFDLRRLYRRLKLAKHERPPKQDPAQQLLHSIELITSETPVAARAMLYESNDTQ